MPHPFDRSVIFTMLLAHDGFGTLPTDLGSLVVDDVLAMYRDEGRNTIADTVTEFISRITPADTGVPAFETYAECLAIELRRARDRALSHHATPDDEARLTRHNLHVVR